MISAALIRRLFSGWSSRTVRSPAAQATLQDSLSTGWIDPGRWCGPGGDRVDLLDHLHDADAREGVAVQDRPRDRLGSAVPRQQRGMDVQAIEAGHLEDLIAELLAVGHHDDHVGRQRAQLAEELVLVAV